MKLAILGTRGIPANYGGFETFADELSRRLVEQGHEVTVVGRRRWVGKSRQLDNGVHTRNVVTLRGKYSETVSASVLSGLLPGLPDCVLLCNTASFAALPLLRLRGIRVIMNVDGRDGQRRKWGRVGRAWYRMGEWVATRMATTIVADAKVLSDHFGKVSRRPVVVITYGADSDAGVDGGVLESYGLEPGKYVLYVSRFEPENNPDLVMAAYARSGNQMPLVMVGAAAYDRRLGRKLQEMAGADPRVRLLGAVYGDAYRQLQRGAAVYIQATEVGGTHPALIEAMAAGNAVFCMSTPENREVLGDAGVYFDSQASLTELLDEIPQLDLEQMGAKAAARAEAFYSWAQVVRSYEALLGPS